LYGVDAAGRQFWPQARSDAAAVLSQNMQITSGTAESVGRATGLAISTPVSVVDPETRNHLGDAIDEFKDSVRRIGSDRPD
jgi:hypothetical protein